MLLNLLGYAFITGLDSFNGIGLGVLLQPSAALGHSLEEAAIYTRPATCAQYCKFMQGPTACLLYVQVKKSMCRIKAVMWERARALDNPADTARLKEFIDAL